MHLNINSTQNKFEELKKLKDALKAHILVVTETKIDSSYPNNQFNLNGYHMYRKDRVKGGRGLIVYFSAIIPSKKLTLPRAYKTLKAIAIESRIERTDMVLLAIYTPPKPSRKRRKMPSEEKYLQRVEEEINGICQWASSKTKLTVIIVSDLNMDIFRPYWAEGEILTDLKEVNNLKYLITEPTGITVHSQTLLDVLLANTPERFDKS